MNLVINVQEIKNGILIHINVNVIFLFIKTRKVENVYFVQIHLISIKKQKNVYVKQVILREEVYVEEAHLLHMDQLQLSNHDKYSSLKLY